MFDALTQYLVAGTHGIEARWSQLSGVSDSSCYGKGPSSSTTHKEELTFSILNTRNLITAKNYNAFTTPSLVRWIDAAK